MGRRAEAPSPRILSTCNFLINSPDQQTHNTKQSSNLRFLSRTQRQTAVQTAPLTARPPPQEPPAPSADRLDH